MAGCWRVNVSLRNFGEMYHFANRGADYALLDIRRKAGAGILRIAAAALRGVKCGQTHQARRQNEALCTEGNSWGLNRE
jgi:hypothetical protein